MAGAGNAINETTTGITGFTGTAFVGTPATQYNVIVGGATSSTLANVAPSATSGVPLVSGGAAANPSFTTAVVAGGGTGNTTFTAYSVITAGTTATGAFQNVSGVGTSGQVLTSAGASTLPAWGNGGWVKITTVTASNSAALTITSGISSTYNNYALVFSNVNPTSNGNLTLQISSDSGATYKATNYFSGFNGFVYNSTTFANVNGTTAFFICQTNTSYFSSGCVYFNSFTDGQYPAMTGNASTTNPASEIIGYVNTGVYRTQITVNAVSIANSAGNLSVGEFTLYGLVK